MAKVTTRKETGKLVIDFTYQGVRCREQTALGDTVENRRRIWQVVKRIKEKIAARQFRYREFFPESPMCARFEQVLRKPDDTKVTQEESNSLSPQFKVFANQWVDEHSVEWRRSHLKSLVSTLNGRLIPAFGEKVVSSITKSDILAFRAALAKEPGRAGKAGLSAKRINEIMGTLKQIIEEAADRFEFTSPVTNVKRLRVRKSDVQPFSLQEVQTILTTVRADYRDYLQVRFLTGMRTGEVNGLKWKYVDFDRRLLLVRETYVLGGDEYTKTDGSQREIRMSQPVVEALARQHQVTHGKSEYVFCNMLGTPLDNTNFTKRIWYPLLRYLGYELRRPYQTRHTAATLWLAAGEAPEWIARQLGHTSTEMLFRTYSRYVPNMTRQDGSAMDRLLASQMATGNLLVRVDDRNVGGVEAAETERGPAVYAPVHAHQRAIAPQAIPKPRGVGGARLKYRSSHKAEPGAPPRKCVGPPKRCVYRAHPDRDLPVSSNR